MTDFVPKCKQLPPGVEPVKPEKGQTSVWDFPRPAKLLPAPHKITVVFGGQVLIETEEAFMVVETSHPPSYYLPRCDLKDIAMLKPISQRSLCEWKGEAHYFDLQCDGHEARQSVWTYPQPTKAFQEIENYLAFYPQLMDACYVDGELVQPQPGRFYGGWVSPHYVGPFKGEPESMFW